MVIIIIVDKSGLVGVCPPHAGHVFNGNALGLRQEESHKCGHEDHKEGEEDEEAKLHVADRAWTSEANLQGEYLTGNQVNQPPEWAPLPSKTCHVDAYEQQNHNGIPLGQLPGVPVHPKLCPNCNRNDTWHKSIWAPRSMYSIEY